MSAAACRSVLADMVELTNALENPFLLNDARKAKCQKITQIATLMKTEMFRLVRPPPTERLALQTLFAKTPWEQQKLIAKTTAGQAMSYLEYIGEKQAAGELAPAVNEKIAKGLLHLKQLLGCGGALVNPTPGLLLECAAIGKCAVKGGLRVICTQCKRVGIGLEGAVWKVESNQSIFENVLYLCWCVDVPQLPAQALQALSLFC